MKDIQLDELPKSKEFMKHTKIADGLSKETGLEHGFRFCKPNNEIIVDKMCVGTECNIKISSSICDNFENKFHTHRKLKKVKSNFSVSDIHSSAICSYNLKRPHITCVKSTTDNNILCYKSNIKNKKIARLSETIKDDFNENPTLEGQEKALNLYNIFIKPEKILFDSKTGKIVK